MRTRGDLLRPTRPPSRHISHVTSLRTLRLHIFSWLLLCRCGRQTTPSSTGPTGPASVPVPWPSGGLKVPPLRAGPSVPARVPPAACSRPSACRVTTAVFLGHSRPGGRKATLSRPSCGASCPLAVRVPARPSRRSRGCLGPRRVLSTYTHGQRTF